MSGGNTLVPITRPVLKEFYQKHPAPALHPAFHSRSQHIAALVEQRGKQAGKALALLLRLASCLFDVA
jgi:hypothetical protein